MKYLRVNINIIRLQRISPSQCQLLTLIICGMSSFTSVFAEDSSQPHQLEMKHLNSLKAIKCPYRDLLCIFSSPLLDFSGTL